jgi:SAM-dependent methyltransferase
LADRGAIVTAVDCSPDMLALAERNVGSQARIVCADLNAPLDFLESQAIDLVFCSLTLHYLAEWGPALDEFRRVLVPGGTLVFSTHHPFADHQWGGQSYFAVERIRQTWTEFGDKTYDIAFYRRPLSAMVAALTQAGFQIDQIVEPQPAPDMARRYPKTFAALSEAPVFILFKAH